MLESVITDTMNKNAFSDFYSVLMDSDSDFNFSNRQLEFFVTFFIKSKINSFFFFSTTTEQKKSRINLIKQKEICRIYLQRS